MGYDVFPSAYTDRINATKVKVDGINQTGARARVEEEEERGFVDDQN